MNDLTADMNASRAAARVSDGRAAVCALMFASGCASLVYQVLWVKQLTLVVGVEVQAVSVAIGAFFAGLAIGAWLFGGIADRRAQPVRLYAALELATLVLGIGATLSLARCAQLFATLETHAGPLAWALPFLLVGVPAIAMGGTLPVMLRALAPSRDAIGGAGGRLYAANTAGAIAGALLPAFVLIPALGVQGSACAAGLLNLLAAIGAFVLSHLFRKATHELEPSMTRRASHRARAQANADADAVHARIRPARPDTAHGRVAIALYAAAGGVALGYEVIWPQAIAQFVSTRTFAFSIVLATYLFGLASGSAVAARFATRVRDAWSAFGVLIAAAGLAAFAGVALAGDWLSIAQQHASAIVMSMTHNALASMCAGFVIAACAIVLVPTMLLGAAFPFALRMACHDDASTQTDTSGTMQPRPGAAVGRVLAMNTAGGIAGTLFAGFVLVPSLGLIRALGVLSVAASLLGLSAALSGRVTHKAGIGACACLTAATVISVLMTPPDRLGTLLAQAHHGRLAFYEESAGGTVAVIEQGDGAQRFHRLYIQGVSNSGDAMTSQRYMRLQALTPLIVHGGTPRSALVIGLGTGITAGALLAWPGLQTRAVAELLPAVVRASSRFNANLGAGADPRIDIRVTDGRRDLLARADRYDVITLEPPPPSAAGVVNLYSTDFYRLAAGRLNERGIVAQWLPLATQNEAQTRALIRSFVEVFPHAALWTTEFHEMMLIGSNAPLTLDVATIRARFAAPEVAQALRDVGIASPEALLATWIADGPSLAYYAADARPVTDDARPVTDDDPGIEYAPWVQATEFAPTLAHVLALQSEPPLTHADPAFVATMRAERATLHTFYRAGLNAYRGDRNAWANDIRDVLSADADNAYYRWVLGGGNSHP